VSADERIGMVPVISVILPVYNGAAYLTLAVESILNQSFGDFELIAIEGGSRDSSPEILAGLADRDARIRVAKQAGPGLVGALNQGIALSRGEFLARMDADDVAHPERFAVQLDFLRCHPDIAVVGAAMTLIDAAGRRLRDIDYPVQPADVARALESGSALAHPAVMMRRGAVQEVGGYREILDHAEDYDLWLRMSERGLLANLPDRLLSYRQHAGKRGSIFAFEQELHTQFARLSATARRAGHADPLDALSCLDLNTLDRFAIPAAERERLVFELLGPLLAAPGPNELAKAAEVIRLLGPSPIDRARAAQKKTELSMLYFKAARPVATLTWAVRAIGTRPGESIRILAAIGRRVERRLAAAGTRLLRSVRT